jgi:hypothetical protein
MAQIENKTKGESVHEATMLIWQALQYRQLIAPCPRTMLIKWLLIVSLNEDINHFIDVVYSLLRNQFING